MDLLDFRKTVTEDFYQWSQQLLFACAAIGFMTMTVVEMYKKFRRPGFNRHMIYRWLEYGNGASEKDLITLSTGGDDRAFYNLAIENLCGQIVAALQAMFESPSKYEKLIAALLKRQAQDKKDNVEEDDYSFLINYDRGKNFANSYENDPMYNKYVSVRSRLSTQIQRNLDAFQIRSTYMWQTRIRFYTLAASFGLTAIIAFLVGGELLTLSGIVFFLLAAYLSAFTASIFRDILSVMERLKK